MDTLAYPVTTSSSVKFAVTGAQVTSAQLSCNGKLLAEVVLANVDPKVNTPLEFFADSSFHVGLLRGEGVPSHETMQQAAIITVYINYITKSGQFPQLVIEELPALTWEKINAVPGQTPFVYLENVEPAAGDQRVKRVLCYTPLQCGYISS